MKFAFCIKIRVLVSACLAVCRNWLNPNSINSAS